MTLFHLNDRFIQQYIGHQPKWGPIGYVTYKRTYARDLDKIFDRHAELAHQANLTGNEEYWLTLTRVVEGMFGILKDHCTSLKLPWDDSKAQEMAQEAYDQMWNFRWLPAGRGLWMMGTPALAKIGGACLNSCAFFSTKNMLTDFSASFTMLMDFSMLGVGVGSDTSGAGQVMIVRPAQGDDVHVISDDRTGWVAILKRVLDAYVGIGSLPGKIDDSYVRPAGSPISGFGGTASGPEPLMELIQDVTKILDEHIGQYVTSTLIVDIKNLIGRCVVAGNVRRSAELMLGAFNDNDFLELKDFDKDPWAVDHHRWASNNSIVAEIGQSYDRVAELTQKNGEPGVFWLENARRFGRMIDPVNWDDEDVDGSNPCITADTIIDTSDGPKRVDELLDVPFKAVVSGKTFRCHRGFRLTGRKPVYVLETHSGHTLKLTADHKILTTEEDEAVINTYWPYFFRSIWTEAQNLSDDDLIFLNDGTKTTKKSLIYLGKQDVYDCTVADIHAFSANGIIVHNCLEQSLNDRELCCLVETFPFNHDTPEKYARSVKFAYLYAKTVTLVPTHDPRVNAVTMKNRRIGCSMAGITQAMKKFGRRAFLDMCDSTYQYICDLDKEYSGWLCVPESIKKTSVKPGGTVPLLCGATPGIHYPISEYYWRVIRFATDSKMLPALRTAGYRCIEIDPSKEPNTTAVYFPVHEQGFDRGVRDVSMWEQLELAAAMQAYWADNQVSVTVSFDRKCEGKDIARALELYETRLKGVSFLPHSDHGYEHAPYQPISKEEYESATATLKPLDLIAQAAHEVTDAFCDGDKCLLPGIK